MRKDEAYHIRQVVVRLVDVGSDEVLDGSALKRMPENFLRFPSFAVVVSMRQDASASTGAGGGELEVLERLQESVRRSQPEGIFLRVTKEPEEGSDIVEGDLLFKKSGGYRRILG